MADYALSGACLAGVYLDEARRRAEEQGFSYDLLVQCDPAFMRTTLAHLRTRYGGIEAYVRATGLGDAEIDRLRRAMVAQGDALSDQTGNRCPLSLVGEGWG